MSFSFYCVEPSYCDYLREYDPKVPYTMDKKSTRPFIGIVLNINGFDYFAPLTSPKPKHLKMKNQIDFLKINNGIWGAINFNNMIPVPQCCLSRISMEILPTDTQDEIAYKNLLMNQLSWCNMKQHTDAILEKALRLYTVITTGRARKELVERCCDFHKAELQYWKFGIAYGEPISEAHQEVIEIVHRATQDPTEGRRR